MISRETKKLRNKLLEETHGRICYLAYTGNVGDSHFWNIGFLDKKNEFIKRYLVVSASATGMVSDLIQVVRHRVLNEYRRYKKV